MWFANYFHLWLRHLWQSSANHLTCDQKSSFTVTHALFDISFTNTMYIRLWHRRVMKYLFFLKYDADQCSLDRLIRYYTMIFRIATQMALWSTVLTVTLKWTMGYLVWYHMALHMEWQLQDIGQVLYSLRRPHLIGIGIPIINLRRSSDRFRFMMGIHIPVRQRLFSQ